MQCQYLTNDGLCDGRYKGFACIGPRCKAEREPVCEHYDQGFYCKKFRRFGCIGLSKCRGELGEYMRVCEEAKARA